jgi:Kdo2-lipid IVA lauroyltransferase/acyltransferase
MAKFLFILLKYIIGYRVTIVKKNINYVGLNLDLNKYYHHFSKNLLASIYSFVASPSKIQSRVVYENLPTIQNEMSNGKRVMLLATHYSNWEWVGVNLPSVLKGDCIAVYKPLSNQFFNKLVTRSRARTGMKLAAMSEVVRFIKQYEQNVCFLFIADQSPSIYQSAVSVNFLGKTTSFLDGPQKLVNRYPFEIYYQSVNEKDGKYLIEFIKIDDHQNLMQTYANLLEKDIKNDPYLWLWTHKRWKREGVF